MRASKSMGSSDTGVNGRLLMMPSATVMSVPDLCYSVSHEDMEPPIIISDVLENDGAVRPKVGGFQIDVHFLLDQLILSGG